MLRNISLSVLSTLIIIFVTACSQDRPNGDYITPVPALDSETSRQMLQEFTEELSRISKNSTAHLTFLVEDNSCVVVLDGDYSKPYKAKNFMVYMTVNTTQKIGDETGIIMHDFTTICGDKIYNMRDNPFSGYYYTYHGNEDVTVHATRDPQVIFKYRNWYLWTIERDVTEDKVPS